MMENQKGITVRPYSTVPETRGSWLRLVAGIVTVAIGVAAFVWPHATVHVVGLLFGLNLLVTGVIRAGVLLFAPGYPLLPRILGVAFGILTAIVGILCLRNITGSVRLLLIIVAIGWLLDGLVEIVLAVGGPSQAGAGWRIGVGLVTVLGAIALLVWPVAGITAAVFLGASVLIIVGISTTVSAVVGLGRGSPAEELP